MLFDASLPQQRAGLRLDGTYIAALIAEIGGGSMCTPADSNSSTNRETGVEYPVDAAALGVERVDLAAGTPDKEASANDSRLRVSARIAGKPERPLKLQPRNFVCFQLRHRGGLEAVLRQVDTPS